MATVTRAKLSKKNEYFVEKHRYYELKHFCLQYSDWKKEYATLDSMVRSPIGEGIFSSTISDPTADCAIAKEFYYERIKLIERVAKATDETLASYILKGVTGSVSYESLRARHSIPCCKNVYYKLYRRFFWLLSKERD